jgi:hypothetical protein
MVPARKYKVWGKHVMQSFVRIRVQSKTIHLQNSPSKFYWNGQIFLTIMGEVDLLKVLARSRGLSKKEYNSLEKRIRKSTWFTCAINSLFTQGLPVGHLAYVQNFVFQGIATI